MEAAAAHRDHLVPVHRVAVARQVEAAVGVVASQAQATVARDLPRDHRAAVAVRAFLAPAVHLAALDRAAVPAPVAPRDRAAPALVDLLEAAVARRVPLALQVPKGVQVVRRDHLAHRAAAVVRLPALVLPVRDLQAGVAALATTCGTVLLGQESRSRILVANPTVRSYRSVFVLAMNPIALALTSAKLFTPDVRNKGMESTRCPHDRDGLCQISTSLAEVPVMIAVDACSACEQIDKPRNVNQVTCSKALHARTLIGLPPTDQLLQCLRPQQPGVGTELAKLIETTRQLLRFVRLGWLIPQNSGCGCGELREEMNAAGTVGCRAQLLTYAAQIRERWQTFVPVTGKIPGLGKLIQLYIYAAIARAQRKEVES